MSIVSILTSPSDRRTPADRGRTAASSAGDCGIGRAYFPDVSPTAGVFDAEHVADLWSSAKLGPFFLFAHWRPNVSIALRASGLVSGAVFSEQRGAQGPRSRESRQRQCILWN